MRRLRLKADGRIVELVGAGEEAPLVPAIADWLAEPLKPLPESLRPRKPTAPNPPDVGKALASDVRGIRAQASLTQIEFAEKLGVPVETIRNWEQGKRAPRGPARALLALIGTAPDFVFQILGRSQEMKR